MPAELLSFSKSENTIVLIENKIGSKFTSAGTQLIRQAKFLEKSGFKNKILIVLTSELFLSKGWYLSEMQNVIDNVEGVKVFAMKWEDIFNAIESKGIN
ncbi:PD-(D/E)XK nuclease family protein [Pseudoalteromonas sp. Z9A5]|uniref:PD-(D/E)XK nuclease family protein n=1 Tax=Pseudoalteromonas sp. Z9A5 TaxID=2686355 RepID=UPI00140B5737|nr:PD-(D/E)XK nuclease family protein [Pseudoalteromonas sp. Z9A5]